MHPLFSYINGGEFRMKREFSHKISLGQNFLGNPLVIQRSVDAGELTVNDTVLEIGSGKGVLTRKILESPARCIHALEIDRRLEPWLVPLENCCPERLKIHWADATEFPLAKLSPAPNKILANIPYNITTPLIWKILTDLAPLGLECLILLVQKEAAERLAAPLCSKNRYPLGITIELMGEIEPLMKVSPGSFYPPPKVWSSLIKINILRRKNLASDEAWRAFIFSAFAQRRKKLINNFIAADYEKDYLESTFDALKIPITVRAEELRAQQWLNLYEILKNSRT